jgi:hypothetical protein
MGLVEDSGCEPDTACTSRPNINIPWVQLRLLKNSAPRDANKIFKKVWHEIDRHHV